MIDLETIVGDAKASFSAALTPADLENAKALFLGKTDEGHGAAVG